MERSTTAVTGMLLAAAFGQSGVSRATGATWLAGVPWRVTRGRFS